jgi:hypothetical protein
MSVIAHWNWTKRPKGQNDEKRISDDQECLRSQLITFWH